MEEICLTTKHGLENVEDSEFKTVRQLLDCYAIKTDT